MYKATIYWRTAYKRCTTNPIRILSLRRVLSPRSMKALTYCRMAIPMFSPPSHRDIFCIMQVTMLQPLYLIHTRTEETALLHSGMEARGNADVYLRCPYGDVLFSFHLHYTQSTVIARGERSVNAWAGVGR